MALSKTGNFNFLYPFCLNQYLKCFILKDLGHQPVYWKSRNSKPTRRYEEVVLTPPSSPERSVQTTQSRAKQSDNGQPVKAEKSTVAQALLQSSSSLHEAAMKETPKSPARLSAQSSPEKKRASPRRKEEGSVSSVRSAVTDSGTVQG